MEKGIANILDNIGEMHKQAFAFAIIFAVFFASIWIVNSESPANLLTGYAVAEAQNILPVPAAEEQGVKEYSTDDGLVLSYQPLEQGEITIGNPVEWHQKINVFNPLDVLVADSVFQLELPSDASGIEVYLGGEKISDNLLVKLPSIDSKENLELLAMFETSPVMMEITEEKAETKSIAGIPLPSRPVKKVRIWHDSALHYANIPVEIDSSLGEKLVEAYGETERGLSTAYSGGKSRWIIKRM